MEKLSRVKKYEDLRKNIEADTTHSGEVPQGDKLSSYANQLNGIDPTVFKKVSIKEESDYTPGRERRNDYFKDELDAPIASFTNEYLDDFISEVKEYNIKKGVRENENTEMDILNQLHNVTRKRSQYIEPMKKVTPIEEPNEIENTMSREDIAQQVKELLLEEPNLQPEPTPVMQEPVYQKPIVEKQDTIVYEKMPTVPVEEPQMQEAVDPMHARLVEETQQLRVQLDEYEGELTDLNEGIDKTNRILNIILCTLIFVLIFVIGIIVFWLVQEGGILS